MNHELASTLYAPSGALRQSHEAAGDAARRGPSAPQAPSPQALDTAAFPASARWALRLLERFSAGTL
ncbi:MAG: hypothetical protein H6R03_1355, partial [Burkholderiaceae bacterium]|nr:hypothetical protein [Burkholderiaceae bacterium]